MAVMRQTLAEVQTELSRSQADVSRLSQELVDSKQQLEQALKDMQYWRNRVVAKF